MIALRGPDEWTPPGPTHGLAMRHTGTACHWLDCAPGWARANAVLDAMAAASGMDARRPGWRLREKMRRKRARAARA